MRKHRGRRRRTCPECGSAMTRPCRDCEGESRHIFVCPVCPPPPDPDSRIADRIRLLTRSRWEIIVVCSRHGYSGATDTNVHAAMQGRAGLSLEECRTQMAYLEEADVIRLERPHPRYWRATLTRLGHDIHDYVVPAPAGIARPRPYPAP